MLSIGFSVPSAIFPQSPFMLPNPFLPVIVSVYNAFSTLIEVYVDNVPLTLDGN